MRPTRAARSLRRKQLDRVFRSLSGLRAVAIPPGGWLRAIRQALGMSTYQLASRAHLDPSTIRGAEAREAAGTISLETLSKIADALDCDLYYCLLPREGALEDAMRSRALSVARALVGPVQHTMALEAQSLGNEHRDEQIQELAEELVRTESRDLWTMELPG